MNRREFLRATAAGLAVSTVGGYVPAFAEPKPRRVGLIGTGWYGKSALLRLLQVEPAEVVALCDVDSRMLAEAAEIVAGRQKSKKRCVDDSPELGMTQRSAPGDSTPITRTGITPMGLSARFFPPRTPPSTMCGYSTGSTSVSGRR